MKIHIDYPIDLLLNKSMEKQSKVKSRTRFSALDIKAEVKELSTALSGCKVNTAYDLDTKTYLLKLGKVGVRVNLLIESGVRFHTVTNFTETKDKPNGFTTRLRKHLKSLFFHSIEQIGVERVVRLTFCGADPNNKEFTFYIFIELYAKGNVILTNSDLIVLALLRSHAYSETVKCTLNERYPIEHAAKYRYEDILIEESAIDGIVAANAKGISLVQLVSRLVPCAHQSIAESIINSDNLNSNAKYNESLKDKTLEAAKKLLALYSPDKDFKGGYLYTKPDSKFSFEFSPVQLNYVG